MHYWAVSASLWIDWLTVCIHAGNNKEGWGGIKKHHMWSVYSFAAVFQSHHPNDTWNSEGAGYEENVLKKGKKGFMLRWPTGRWLLGVSSEDFKIDMMHTPWGKLNFLARWLMVWRGRHHKSHQSITSWSRLHFTQLTKFRQPLVFQSLDCTLVCAVFVALGYTLANLNYYFYSLIHWSISIYGLFWAMISLNLWKF